MPVRVTRVCCSQPCSCPDGPFRPRRQTEVLSASRRQRQRRGAGEGSVLSQALRSLFASPFLAIFTSLLFFIMTPHARILLRTDLAECQMLLPNRARTFNLIIPLLSRPRPKEKGNLVGSGPEIIYRTRSCVVTRLSGRRTGRAVRERMGQCDWRARGEGGRFKPLGRPIQRSALSVDPSLKHLWALITTPRLPSPVEGEHGVSRRMHEISQRGPRRPWRP